MKKKSIASLLVKTGVFLLPLFLLLTWYFHSDPFKVLHTYKSYCNNPIYLNQGYINWQSYLNFRDSLHYDSYILGNSCAMAYPTAIWRPFLKNASPIQLNANSESLYGIYKKIKKLDESIAPIKNVLLLLDHGTLRKISPINSHTHIMHPDVSGASKFEFHKEFIVAFLNPKFLIPFLDYSIFNKYRKYMNGVIAKDPTYRNQLTNDIINPREFEIQNLQDKYWIQHQKEFPERDEENECYSSSIQQSQKIMLNEICKIFNKQKTNYQIVINPEWKQKRFNHNDLLELEKIFGKSHVHDFSGKNRYTENKKLFYEKSHYRPILGKMILKEVYKK